MNGKLCLVATPIGNLDDITYRAIKILKEVDVIAAEDTRHTLKLLNHFNISKPLISYYKQTEGIKTNILIEKLLKGENIAIVSDAGTPGISDPGEEIVKRSIEENIQIIPIPGACALINAIIASGLKTREFIFLGFLPVNKKEKTEKLNEIKNLKQTLIFYESPHKLINTLENMKEILGNREIVLARELTKLHEEFVYGKISDIIGKKLNPKGEFVIVVEGSKKGREDEKTDILNSMNLEDHFQYYEKQNYSKKDIIKQIAKDRKTSKNEIYQYFIEK